jgi:acyl-[acyl-carrier-protein] desaturase
VLRFWGVDELDGLSAEGEKARDELNEFRDGLAASAGRFEEKRDAQRARQVERGQQVVSL